MLSETDLSAAVEARIISQAQSDDLVTFAKERRTLEAGKVPHQERFKIAKNFNEIFVTIGLGMLLIAYGSFVSQTLHDDAWQVGGFAILSWFLAEFLTGRLRMVLPSIVLSISFTGAVAYLVSKHIVPQYGLDELRYAAIAGLVAAGAFFLRFRFPFSWLLIGLSTVALLAALLKVRSVTDDAGLLYFFALGIVLFVTALWFDGRDPLRRGRSSDCGFWLHLVAAPLIVHPMAIMLLDQKSGAIPLFAGLILVLALIALVVDRRAILVSTFAYIGTFIAYVAQEVGGRENATYLTLFILGSFVLFLGVGWVPIRNSVMRMLPDFPGRNALPPIYRKEDLPTEH